MTRVVKSMSLKHARFTTIKHIRCRGVNHSSEWREQQLVTTLEQKGLEYRPSSALHAAYVNNDSEDLTLLKVVNKTAVQKFLREYTRYEEFLNEVHEGTRSEKIARAKRSALEETPIPRTWPWKASAPVQDEDGFTMVGKERRHKEAH